jgi:hypothetical protein
LVPRTPRFVMLVRPRTFDILHLRVKAAASGRHGGKINWQANLMPRQRTLRMVLRIDGPIDG